MLKDVKASVSYLSTASFWLAPCFYFVMNLLPDHMGCFLAIDLLYRRDEIQEDKESGHLVLFSCVAFFFFCSLVLKQSAQSVWFSGVQDAQTGLVKSAHKVCVSVLHVHGCCLLSTVAVKVILLVAHLCARVHCCCTMFTFKLSVYLVVSFCFSGIECACENSGRRQYPMQEAVFPKGQFALPTAPLFFYMHVFILGCALLFSAVHGAAA